jgi:hypothetical protein
MADVLSSVLSPQVNHHRSKLWTGHDYFLLLHTPSIHITVFPILATVWIYIYIYIQEGRGLSDRSGNSGYLRLGDTGAAILQKARELNSSTTENLLWPVAILVKWIASNVQPLLCVFKKSKFLQGKQTFFKYAVSVKFVAVLYIAFEWAWF